MAYRFIYGAFIILCRGKTRSWERMIIVLAFCIFVMIEISGFINIETFHHWFKIANCTMNGLTVRAHLSQINITHKI